MTILHCLDHGANLHESSWHMVSSAQDGLQAILLQLVCDVPANRNEATSATFAVASIFELCRSLAKRLEILRLLAAVWVQWGYLDHQNSFATATERRSIARLPPNTEWYRRLQHLQMHFGEFWSLPSIIFIISSISWWWINVNPIHDQSTATGGIWHTSSCSWSFRMPRTLPVMITPCKVRTADH